MLLYFKRHFKRQFQIEIILLFTRRWTSTKDNFTANQFVKHCDSNNEIFNAFLTFVRFTFLSFVRFTFLSFVRFTFLSYVFYISFVCVFFLSFACISFLSFVCISFLSFVCTVYISFVCTFYISFVWTVYISFVCVFFLLKNFFFGVPHSATFIFVIFLYVIASIAYIHPVYGAGVRTHDLLIVSRLP